MLSVADTFILYLNKHNFSKSQFDSWPSDECAKTQHLLQGDLENLPAKVKDF